MITIEKYTPCRHAQTIELQVLEDQAQFTVENIGQRLESLKPTELPHLILEDDRVVGFFLFDAAYSEDYDFCPQRSLGVRSLLVDRRHQGVTKVLRSKPLVCLGTLLSCTIQHLNFST